MALEHAKPGTAIDIKPLGLQIAGIKSTALFKSRDLEVIRLVLATHGTLPPHSVPGEITIQCLEGELAVNLVDGALVLQAGEMVYLEGGTPHGVWAVTACSALLTIALREVRSEG